MLFNGQDRYVLKDTGALKVMMIKKQVLEYIRE
jgi:hypothetical protein